VSSDASESPRKSTPFGRIALVFVALFVIGVGVALAMHRTFVAAERVVAHHLPADAAAAVRVDLEKATLFAPVRRFLLPLLDENPPAGKPRWERLADHSELVVGRDTRELLVFWGPGPNDWAVALGGNYPTGVLPALGEVLREEGAAWRQEGERLIAPSGYAVAQAADHALLLASNVDRLEKARPSTDAHARLGIPLKGAFAFVGEPRRLPWLARQVASLGDVARVTAVADWSSPLVVRLELHYAKAPPPGVAALVQERLAVLVGPEEAKRLESVVGPPTVEIHGTSVLVTTRWDHDALERLAERLAAAMRAQSGSAQG
jgi:hypothetical protein